MKTADTLDLKKKIDIFLASYENKHYIKPINDEGNCNLTENGLVSLLFNFYDEFAQPSDVSDEDIDAFYPIKNEHTALTMQFIDTNKARREGAKAMRDGKIKKGE